MKANLMNGLKAIAAFSIAAMLFSCKKDEHNPPKLEFKSGTTYVSADRTLKKDTTIIVGITATKTEDEFKTFNVSYSYDGANDNTTFSTENISGHDEDGFSRDVSIHIRNQTGMERWTFTVIDKDGNTTRKGLYFNVP